MPPDTRLENRRRWLVRLLMAFYLALLGEGVLRKWVMPGMSNALVFLRDPILVLVVLAYARFGASRDSKRLLGALWAVVLLFVLCAACQGVTTSAPILVLLFGFRNYLVFVPVCLAVRDAFEREDYARWIKLNLALAGPVAAIVMLQFESSPAAWINAVPGGSNEGVFLVVPGVVRPYGVFSFTLGHSVFAAWMLGVVVAAGAGRRAMGIGRALLGCGATAVLLMGALSGSRTYLLLAGSAVVGFIPLAVLFGPPRLRVRAVRIVLTAACLGGMTALTVPSVISNLLDRQTTAVAAEGSTFDRVGRVVTEFTAQVEQAPVFGFGLGSGTNIANFLVNGRTDHVLAEYELTRVVQELGPVFGLAYIGLRWWLVGWFLALAVGAARRGNLQPACYLGVLAPLFLAHDITLQNTMIGIAWFATGIFLVAVRIGPDLEWATLPAADSAAVRRPVFA